MSHMVIFRSAEGKPGYHQAEELDDAVSFVERLRNSDGVEHARIFRMEEMTFEFRPYFRVELRDGAEADTDEPEMHEAPVAEVTPDTDDAVAEETSEFAPQDEPADDEHETVGAGNGVGSRRGLFGR